MDKNIKKNQKRIRRKKSIRKKVFGTSVNPRVSVFRSNTQIYAQAIDDVAGITIASANSIGSKAKTLTDKSSEVGKTLGNKLKAKKVKQAIFDRNGYKFHGKVKALVGGIKESGIKI